MIGKGKKKHGRMVDERGRVKFLNGRSLLRARKGVSHNKIKDAKVVSVGREGFDIPTTGGATGEGKAHIYEGSNSYSLD